MKCLILAAGYATRLYPLTENFPKPLLEIKGKTILDWLIDDLNKTKQIDKYYLVSNHRYYEHFLKWAQNKNVEVLDDQTTCNEKRLGALKDIEFVLDTYKLDEDLLIMAGDNLLDFSLKYLLDYAKEKGTTCVMKYPENRIEKLQKSGVASVDENDVITLMEEKPQNPKGEYLIPPFYYISRSDLSLLKQAIKDGINVDAPGSFIAYIASKSTVHAMSMKGKRYDIGTLESYNEIKENYKGINDVND